MICNKCGKNNPAGAEKCSNCKEPMPAITNCGGFSDILTYTAPPTPEASPSVVPVAAPVPQPVRHVVDAPVDEPWYKELLTKKNIIILSAIAACLIAIIILIVTVLVNSGDNVTPEDDDKASKVVTPSENPDPEAPPTDKVEEAPVELFTLAINDDGEFENNNQLELKFEDGKNEIEFKLLDCEDKPVGIFIYDVSNSGAFPDKEPSLTLEKGTGYSIVFYATRKQFPLTVGKDIVPEAEKFELWLDDANQLVWKEKQKEEPKNDVGKPEGDDPDNPPSSDFVEKTATVNISKCGFNCTKGTKVQIEYNNEIVNANDLNTLYTRENPMVPIKVMVEKETNSIDLVVIWTEEINGEATTLYKNHNVPLIQE